MYELYENIKNFRIAKGWTQEELCQKMGYKEKSIISKIEKGKVDLQRSKIEEFANVFGVSPARLMGWVETKKVVGHDGNTYETIIGKECIEPGYTIRLLGRVAAGVPIEAQESLGMEIDVPFKYSNREEYFGLKIKGDSMEPKISNGDIVIVHLQECAESGDIIIAQVSQGDATCKRFMQYGDTVLLRSFNSAYEDIDVTGDSEFKIIGRVVESRHTF